MRNYHLYFQGEERNIWAAGYFVNPEGSLTFVNVEGAAIASYAKGEWTYVEVERLDDKGYPGDGDIPVVDPQ